MKWIVGVVQMDTGDEKEKNILKAEKWIRELAEKGAKLIVFPENMHCIGENRGEGGPRREPLDGFTVSRLVEKAREFGVYVLIGSIAEEIPGENRNFNTSVLLNPEGRKAAVYRKLHTYDVTLPDGTEIRESDWVRPGREIIVVKTELGNLGLSICYDLRFPELYRLLALQGAEMILVPANFLERTGKAHWESLLRARAIENGCYVVAANQYGKKPTGIEAFGNSMVIDPWGTVITRAADHESCFTAEIDPDEVKRIRSQIPSLKNRRGDVYNTVVTEGELHFVE